MENEASLDLLMIYKHVYNLFNNETKSLFRTIVKSVRTSSVSELNVIDIDIKDGLARGLYNKLDNLKSTIDLASILVVKCNQNINNPVDIGDIPIMLNNQRLSNSGVIINDIMYID